MITVQDNADMFRAGIDQGRTEGALLGRAELAARILELVKTKPLPDLMPAISCLVNDALIDSTEV